MSAVKRIAGVSEALGAFLTDWRLGCVVSTSQTAVSAHYLDSLIYLLTYSF